VAEPAAAITTVREDFSAIRAFAGILPVRQRIAATVRVKKLHPRFLEEQPHRLYPKPEEDWKWFFPFWEWGEPESTPSKSSS